MTMNGDETMDGLLGDPIGDASVLAHEELAVELAGAARELGLSSVESLDTGDMSSDDPRVPIDEDAVRRRADELLAADGASS